MALLGLREMSDLSLQSRPERTLMRSLPPIAMSTRPSHNGSTKRERPFEKPVHGIHLISHGRSRWFLSAFGAGSTGRRNTGVKFLCRGFKSQGLAWPLIELAG